MNKKLKAKIVEEFGTQADFSLNLGVDESTVSRVIRARRVLTSVEIEKWAEALGMSREELKSMLRESSDSRHPEIH
jgi:plasmid maintenance system antidote protein VapI